MPLLWQKDFTMKQYGLPYMGSKDKIADSLMKVLPDGKRFVDLFGGGFDHKKFYNWVDEQPYPIYISSYRLKDTNWELVWAKCKVPLLNQQTKTKKYAVECLYKSK